jgi:hypothetical protein
MSKAISSTRSRKVWTEPVLITHRDLARAAGVSPTLVRAWLQKRLFPPPHVEVEQTIFWLKTHAEEWLATGKWPAESWKRRVT